MSPIVCAPKAPEQPVLTDALRLAVVTEQKAHCAPTTFDRFVRSLKARQYPLDPTTLPH